MKAIYDQMPKLVQREGSLVRIFHSFVEIQIGETIKYEGCNVDIQGNTDYASIVSAIIRSEYPDDRKDSIILNREIAIESPANTKSSKYLSDYKDFQDFRALAKQIATEIITALQ